MRRILHAGLCLSWLVVFVELALAHSDPSNPKYYFVLLVRPSNAPQLSEEAGKRLQEEHMANIRKLHAEHKLLIAGPFVEDTPLRGIFVFRADSLVQAQEWADSDPAVKAGHLRPEVYGPWQIDSNLIREPNTTEGMEQYTLVFMKKGAKWNPNRPEFEETMKRQESFTKNMIEDGSLAIAGSFPIDAAGDLQGLAIFRVGAEEAAKLSQQEPAVVAGFVKAESHRWITGKGVLAPGKPMN